MLIIELIFAAAEIMKLTMKNPFRKNFLKGFLVKKMIKKRPNNQEIRPPNFLTLIRIILPIRPFSITNA